MRLFLIFVICLLCCVVRLFKKFINLFIYVDCFIQNIRQNKILFAYYYMISGSWGLILNRNKIKTLWLSKDYLMFQRKNRLTNANFYKIINIKIWLHQIWISACFTDFFWKTLPHTGKYIKFSFVRIQFQIQFEAVFAQIKYMENLEKL